MGSFFRRVRSTFLFICSTTELRRFKTRNLRTSSKTKGNKTDAQNLENILRILWISWCFSLSFFGTMRLFWKFLDCTKGPPSFVSIFCNRMDVKKIAQGPPVKFFGTMRLFQNSHFSFFFSKIIDNSKGSPFNFLIFCNKLDFQKPKGSPFTILKTLRFLSLRYSAEFGHSRLV